VVPELLSADLLTAARDELGGLLSATDWGSGFDGPRTRKIWAVLAKTRCMDQAALNPLVLDAVERAVGPGTQFSLTFASQVDPGQDAQVLHYDQFIYPLPRDRDVMVTTIWALSDFTAGNGATLVVPGSQRQAQGKPGANTSTGSRLAVVIDYVQPRLRPCEAHALGVDPAQVRHLPQRLQELLGFNQASPYLGFINGQHPREWLTASNRRADH
jgi:ectoine hydroxylase-related dioxygenase (phytanoyl-CoA dioxygenase family)